MLGEADFPSVLEAARLGAEWAWTAIYRDLSPIVLRYLRAHGAREPENLLGEIFVQVVRKLSDRQQHRQQRLRQRRERFVGQLRRQRLRRQRSELRAAN